MKIKIISTPAGIAPDWVREAWVGLELSLGNDPGNVSLTISSPENEGGYPVRTEDALRVLKEKNATAARWWETSPWAHSQYLVFGKQFCELINPNEFAVTE